MSPAALRALARKILEDGDNVDMVEVRSLCEWIVEQESNSRGRPRYGRRPDEAKILKRMQLRRDEGASLLEIAMELNEARLFNSAGRAWTASSVSRVLRRQAPKREP